MKSIFKKSVIYLSISLFMIGFQVDSFAQGNSEKAKEEKGIAKNKPSEEIITGVEKELERQKELEKEHEKMHETDKHMGGKPLQKNKGNSEGDDKGNKYGKMKSDLDEMEFAHIRSEEAKQKMMATHKNMQEAYEAIKRSEEKIAAAKERLWKAEKEETMSDEEIAEKKDKIEKAEAKVAEAAKRLEMQHMQLHEKMMGTKKIDKEEIKEAEEVVIEE
ncbi:hypothetical protein [Marivirga sp.]|uniref:hypothetical protein n=1 Tax=Marivirga sp. TaxID=2018662 RepID=UPI002D806FE1|nr:hypothetical protein [Marivirga sp.]HET8858730.1 hypothetical protein [Marivirga sp.]